MENETSKKIILDFPIWKLPTTNTHKDFEHPADYSLYLWGFRIGRCVYIACVENELRLTFELDNKFADGGNIQEGWNTGKYGTVFAYDQVSDTVRIGLYEKYAIPDVEI